MLFHGSSVELYVGDTVVPGEQIGLSSNGACSKFVYVTGDFGFSMSDVEDWTREGIRSIYEFAVWDAMMWGHTSTEHEGDPSWFYIVDGEIVGIDEHADVAPGSYKLNSATVLAKFEIPLDSEGRVDYESAVRMVNLWKKTHKHGNMVTVPMSP